MFTKFVPARTVKNDYLNDVSKGFAVGHSALNVAGLNSNFNIGTTDLWEQGGLLTYLSSEETMNYVSTDANDTLLGTGARRVFVSGVNDAGLVVTETIEMNGLTPVAGAVPFAVVNFMFVLADAAGVGAANIGAISATAATAATVQCVIRLEAGISKHGFFRIPAGKNAIINAIELNGSKTAGGTNPLLRFNIFARFGVTTPWISIFERALDSSKDSTLIVRQPLSGVFSAGADIRFSCTTDQNTSFAYMRVLGVLYDL
jgi:hypothetical protein